MREIKIFDTTLRDGEQTPGVNYSIEEKVAIALQLEKLGVDIIEAGFPITSQADFEACKKICDCIKDSKVCMLARLNKKDIDRAKEAVGNNKNGVLHVFIASSDIHLKHKLKMEQDELVEYIEEMISYAKTLFDEIEFSCEDASRTSKEFLLRCFQKAIDCGATTINIPDTVGYALPEQMVEIVKYLKANLKAPNIIFSVHIHQDLGLASASSLSCIKAGCDQIECSINGLGERAGNTPLEEVVCAIKLHEDYFDAYTNIDMKLLNDTSVLVSNYSKINPQPNKAIVGHNAFLHESGIHQDGFLKARETYEIINPEMIGKNISECLVVGKHSGKHAMKDWLIKNDYAHDERIVQQFYNEVKKASDYKKNLSIYDLHQIVESINNTKEIDINYDYYLKEFELSYLNKEVKAKIELSNSITNFSGECTSSTPIDAIFKAINKAINFSGKLLNYHIEAINIGSDAKGMVEVKVENNGIEAIGTGLSKDILEASFEAYINAINKVRSEV
ncbi:MAG: 2-isopropylmalate synthase [Erysipelotrichales bacterium]